MAIRVRCAPGKEGSGQGSYELLQHIIQVRGGVRAETQEGLCQVIQAQCATCLRVRLSSQRPFHLRHQGTNVKQVEGLL